MSSDARWEMSQPIIPGGGFPTFLLRGGYSSRWRLL